MALKEIIGGAYQSSESNLKSLVPVGCFSLREQSAVCPSDAPSEAVLQFTDIEAIHASRFKGEPSNRKSFLFWFEH